LVSYAREFKIAALFLNGSDEDVVENGGRKTRGFLRLSDTI
jgi:hypothetical protein